MKIFLPVSVLVSLGMILLSGACSTPPGSAADATSSVPLHFSQHCATCHGADLQGGIAQSLLDGSWQFGSRRNDIFRSIKFGHPHHGMPSWGSILADEEVDSLVSFLLAEEERLGVNKPEIPTEIETQDYLLSVEILVAEGLETPWSIDFMDAQSALITERPGRLRVWRHGQLLPDSILGIPEVRQGGQGGLMDVAVDPDYRENGWIYLAYSHGIAKQDQDDRAPAMTKIVRGKIDNFRWHDEQVLYEAPYETYRTAGHHFGSRIVFNSQGYLFFSIGDRGAMDHAQDLSKPNGKIHRIFPDGRIPESNPFYGRQGVVPSIYSYGHRNPQGLAIHPETDELWDTEHGPLGGDELNLIKPGLNYGWPVISYGINYNGTILTEDVRKDGMEQPNLYWKPSIAVCGLDFYKGELFPKWKNKLLVGALKFEEVQLLDIEEDRVIYKQTILKNAGRVRDVTSGPDGGIYVVLNRPDAVIRLGLKEQI